MKTRKGNIKHISKAINATAPIIRTKGLDLRLCVIAGVSFSGFVPDFSSEMAELSLETSALSYFDLAPAKADSIMYKIEVNNQTGINKKNK
jgi:hypothetical protein